MREKRSSSFYWLAALFGLFVLFLYGPMITILILSFQGPDGGLTFPMNGVSLHWFAKLWEGLGVVDIWAAFRRSLRLGLVVMVLTVVLSLLAGFAYRKRFRGSNVLFYVAVASLIVPSIVVSLGIGLEFRLIDDAIKSMAEAFGWTYVAEHYTTAMGIYTSGLGAQLTWTLPFGLLIDAHATCSGTVEGVLPFGPPPIQLSLLAATNPDMLSPMGWLGTFWSVCQTCLPST